MDSVYLYPFHFMFNTPIQSLKITMLNVGYSMVDKHWNYDNVVSPYGRLYLIKSGNAKVFHHNRIFELKPGFLYLIPALTFSRYQCDFKMEQYYIHFLEELSEGLSVYNQTNFIYEIKSGKTDRLLFERLLELNPDRHLLKEDPKDYDNHQTLKRFQDYNNLVPANKILESNAIIMILLSRFMSDESSSEELPSIPSLRFHQTVAYIQQHLPETLTVKSLADRCYMHPDSYSRLFLQKMGRRPLDYIHEQRLERAKLLLTTTSHSIKEISHLIGYDNPTYFHRLFRRALICSPNHYRKSFNKTGMDS
jgi:AraC-like DNA-binding protein